MDESGDLGFDLTKNGTSKYFIITMLMTENKKILDKIVKKVYQKLSPSQMKQRNGILHSFYETDNLRTYLLQQLSNSNIQIFNIVVDKQKENNLNSFSKQYWYNYFTYLLLDKIISLNLININKNIEFIASRRETNKNMNLEFINNLTQKIDNQNFNFLIKRPNEEKGLQLVDFAAWATFRKYEFWDLNFYKIIENKIIYEVIL